MEKENANVAIGIFNTSPDLLARLKLENQRKQSGRGWIKAKYPWREINVGQSFPVSIDDCKYGTIKSLAYKTGKRLGKKFYVYNHGESYEVARVE